MPEARTAPERRLRARALGVACALAVVLPPSVARADHFDDVWYSRPVKICPFFFSAQCRTTLSLDLVAAYQPTESDDNGKETYARVAVEGAAGFQVYGDFHVGPAVEVGVQDGQFMTGFHVVPKVRARYWVGGSPFSIDLSAGVYAGNSWLDTGDAPRTRLGLQMDAGIGWFGSLQLLGGFAVVPNPGGVYGLQTQAFVGARVSFLALGAGALFALANAR